MAVSYFPEVFATPLWDWETGISSTQFGEVVQTSFNPYHWGPVGMATYTNKVWDTVRVEWVRWTTNYIDFEGREYPYPDNWGSVLWYAIECFTVGNV